MVWPPRNVAVVSDYTSVSLSWLQDGPADEWTVYWEPLDGTEVVPMTVTESQCTVRDVPPGGHEFSIITWYRGVSSAYDGCIVEAMVPELPANLPRIPVVTNASQQACVLDADWISQDAETWQVQLTDTHGRVHQVLTAVNERHATFTDLEYRVDYGVRVRSVTSRGLSPWSDPLWINSDDRSIDTQGHRTSRSSWTELGNEQGVDH